MQIVTLRESRRQAPAETPAPPAAPPGRLPRILETGRCESPGGKPRRRRRLRRRRRRGLPPGLSQRPVRVVSVLVVTSHQANGDMPR